MVRDFVRHLVTGVVILVVCGTVYAGVLLLLGRKVW
jgi:hypothetical protein